MSLNFSDLFNPEEANRNASRIDALRYVAQQNKTAINKCYDTAIELIELAASNGRMFATFDWLPAEVRSRLDKEGFCIRVKNHWESGPAVTVRWDGPLF